MRFTLVRLGIAALMIGTLAGCSGGGGGGGGGTPPVVTPPPPTAAAPSVQVPPGTPVNVAAFTPQQFAALTPVVPEVVVSIASAPQVSFSVTNGAGGPPITGLGSQSKSGTATVASFPNLKFALAKLIPETKSALAGRTLITPSRWVSYIVTTVPSTTTAATATRPTTDNTGTLVDHGNGTYTYTFFRDVTTVAAQVAAMTLTGNNVAADLDDLTFEGNAVHRVSIEISGNAPGTGSNTPTGATTTPGIPITKPANKLFDFVPARVSATSNGAVTAADPSREIVDTQKCNDCHQNLGGFPGASAANVDAEFHGGNRNSTQYCIVCHTDQRKYGRAEATVIPGINGNYDATPDPATPGHLLGNGTYKINGLGVGNLKTHIHKIHMSAGLTKIGYNFGDIAYETACKFPQDVRNCTKCHDGSATSTVQPPNAQGDNWMNVPNRAACGACHDGINFITGTGATLEDKAADVAAFNPVGTTKTGHGGGPQADDAACGFCHAPADINTFHIPVTPPNPANALLPTDVRLAGSPNANTNAASIASNTNRLPVGATKVTYEISSVSLNATRNPVMVFRLLLQNGTAAAAPATFTPFNPALPVGTQEMLPNFMGAPSVYFVYAVPQDGITAPADFNASASSYLRSLWNHTAAGAAAGTLAGPDATTGFYTATITGSTIPANAVMLTGGLGYSYNVTSSLPLTQTNVAGFPTAASTVAGLNPNMPNRTGGLIVIAPNVQKVATGVTGRRAIVDDALCNKCHQELGTFTEDAFHAGQRNDGTTCAWCHNPNRASSGWSADSTSFVHAIHAAAKRTVPFNWHAVSATDGFFTIGYPGILKKCVTCHLPGTFDFSAAGSAIPGTGNNRQVRTVLTGTLVSPSAGDFAFAPATLAPRNVNFGAGFAVDNNGAPTAASTTVANSTNLVTSPIATVCFACHDDALSIAHMQVTGNGTIYAARGTPAAPGVPATGALAKTELCMLCHSSNNISGVGINTVHALP
jgi:OmcA/MtrC family decaheme c-type cytochrome